MANKYIGLVNGIDTEIEGQVTGGTASQAGMIPALDSTGRFDPTLMPVGVAPDCYFGTAYEALNTANPFVYIRADGTIANASGASGGNGVMGFILAAAAAGQPATVFFEGRVTTLSGLTPGARQYLSDVTAGACQSTPVGPGKIHQYLGRAITATTLNFEPDDIVQRV